MAKVGRAARNASRQRVETITGDKTIQSAETGETYLFDIPDGTDVTITLPSPQEGAYFKFVCTGPSNKTVFIDAGTGVTMGGSGADGDIVFTNNDSDGRAFIVTAMNFGGYYNWNGLRVIKSDGSTVHPMAQYTPNISGYDSVGTGAAKMGNLTLPLSVGESIVMVITSCTNCTEEYYFQGYYTEMQ